ncbi:MAG TPA: sigma factor, partial [Pseudomonadota bacterium]|nr:sigma factor [Pseudomonadota bacterium]
MSQDRGHLATLTELRNQAAAAAPDQPRRKAAYKAAVQRFAERHQGLAYDLARRYNRHNISSHDLKQTAMLGLLEAVARWEPERATPSSTFATFAAFRIRHELQELIRKQLPLVRCSELVHKDQHKIRKVRRQSDAKALDPAELARATGLSERRVQAALDTDTRELGYRPLQQHLDCHPAEGHLHEDRVIEAIDARAAGVEATFASLAAELRPRPRAKLGAPRRSTSAYCAWTRRPPSSLGRARLPPDRRSKAFRCSWKRSTSAAGPPICLA